MERQISDAAVESSAPPDVARRYAAASDGLQGEIDQVIIGLPPIDPQSPAAQLTQPEGTRYLVQVGLGVIVACLLLELLATNAIARVGPQLEILGPEEVLLSAIGPARHGPFVLVLGDSVMTDAALRRTMGPAARAETIPAVIRSRAARYVGHDRIVNLSMEGALVNDYGGLSRLLFDQQLFPSAVLIQLDYRVLSPVHDADQNLSRRWLEAYAPTVERPVTGDPGSPEFAARPIDEWFTRTLLRSNAYLLMRGGRHRLNQRVLDTFEGWGLRQPPSPQDTEVLKLLVGPFYRTDIPLRRSRVLPDLLRVIDGLTARHIPVQLCFTPANFAFLGDQVNVAAYRANVAALEAAIGERYAGTGMVRWTSLEGDIPETMFVDHCHLTPEGNRRAADRMLAGLSILLADAPR